MRCFRGIMLCAAALLGAAAARAETHATADAFSAASYSTNGLIFQLDGIENAGLATHDAAATCWIDLVNGKKIALTTNDTVAAKFVRLVASKGFSGLTDAKDATKTITVEVC